MKHQSRACSIVALLVFASAVLVLGGCSASSADGDTRAAASVEDSASGATSDVPSAASADSVVRLDSVGQRLAGVELYTVSRAGGGALVANGTIDYDANRVSAVAPRVEGRIVSVRADLGQPVRAGAVLAVLESVDVGATRGDLARARAALDVARKNFEREQRLYEEQISPQKEMLDAEAEFQKAEADYKAALARLAAIGASADGDGAAFALTAPVGGTVVERDASPGQIVDAETKLFTVADLRHLWISVDVYEGDLARVREGAPATITPTALPTERFHGRVTYAGGVVDPATRTFKVRVEVENAARRLRPGMFAEVRIGAPDSASGVGSDSAGVGGAAEKAEVVVPQTAVQELGDRQIVFVVGSEPGTYIARTVKLGESAGDGRVIIADGLAPGERIAVKGAFQLRAELTKASFGEEE